MQNIKKSFKEKMKEERVSPGTKSLLFWRVLLSWFFAYLLHIVFRIELEYVAILWAVFLITSFILVDKEKMKQIFFYMMSDDFQSNFNFYAKCFITVAVLSTTSMMFVFVVFYKFSPDKIGLIGYGFFITYSIGIYLVKRFNLLKMQFCEEKGGKHE